MAPLVRMRSRWRWWCVVAIGLVVTTVCLQLVREREGVYFTRTEVVFLAPTSTTYPNALRTQSEDIIDTAGAVAKLVSGTVTAPKYSSPDATLVGVGVRDGWSITLPDTGGQWGSDYSSQDLMVDIVSPDRSVVVERQERLTRAIRVRLKELQDGLGVKPINQITAIVAPESAVIYYVAGDKRRAMVMTFVLGVGATGLIAGVADRRTRSPRRARAAMEVSA